MIQVPNTNLATSKISAFEGFRTHPYRDSVGVATIGFGTTHYADGRSVSMDDGPITMTEALQCLQHDLAGTANHLAQVLTRQPTMNQWSAMCSIAYNIGWPAITKSTLVADFNAGNLQGAADQFLVWDKGHVNGELVVIPGLLKRRQSERELFLTAD